MDIYGLEVIEVPTNLKVSASTKTTRSIGRRRKVAAIVTTIADCSRRKQPILVGTTSIEKSEQLSALLKTRSISADLGVSLKAQAEKLKAAKEGKTTAEGANSKPTSPISATI